MQPLNDDELRGLLRLWHAPPTPSSLENRVLAAARSSPLKSSPLRGYLRWLATGSIRVPVPVGVVACVLLLLLAFQVLRAPKQPVGSLSQFQPVTELRPRIIRSSYEAR
jgi:hypothetical protein